MLDVKYCKFVLNKYTQNEKWATSFGVVGVEEWIKGADSKILSYGRRSEGRQSHLSYIICKVEVKIIICKVRKKKKKYRERVI